MGRGLAVPGASEALAVAVRVVLDLTRNPVRPGLVYNKMDNAAASQWMRSVKTKDATALSGDFEEVVKLCQPKIFRFVLASLRDRDAAETVTQDCFLKAFQARDRFRHDCSVDTWLMRIAINLVRDHTRNRRWQFWRRAEQTARPIDGLSNWLGDGRLSPEAHTSLK